MLLLFRVLDHHEAHVYRLYLDRRDLSVHPHDLRVEPDP
jgi:hypothetical protein